MKNIQVGNCTIGPGAPPFIIAEISGNHNQSVERAHKLIDAIADTGAQAVKFQTYTADTLTLNETTPDFVIDDPSSPWNGETLYALYEKAHTPWEWHGELFQHARERGLIPFSTPFDETAVAFLEELDTPIYKIASFENNHFPLIREVVKTGKPLIVSTGAATLEDIEEMTQVLKTEGCESFILLKCTSTYPAPPHSSNVLTIPAMQERFGCHVGLSDHTLGIGVPIAAVAQGAVVIEKHVTLDRNDGGVDAAFSLEPSELKSLVQESKRAHESLGEVQYGIQKEEEKSIRFKRSIYVSKDIKQGETFSKENIRIVRPGYGIQPKHYEDVLGKVATSDITAGTALAFTHFASE